MRRTPGIIRFSEFERHRVAGVRERTPERPSWIPQGGSRRGPGEIAGRDSNGVDKNKIDGDHGYGSPSPVRGAVDRRASRGRPEIMPRLERKHALATRIFHWANVPILAVMIWSGLLIYWANSVYQIRLGRITLVRFFPEWFYQTFHIHHRLAEGMAWHFTFMWFFALNGLLYVAFTAWSGEWRHLVPNRRTFGEAWQVVLHDLGLRKQPLPRRKFNGAQRLAYTGVIAMGAGSLLTGLAIYKPVQAAWLTTLLGGYPAARLEHFCLTVGYCLFFLIHIAQVVKTGWNNFRAMLTGYEVVPVEQPAS